MGDVRGVRKILQDDPKAVEKLPNSTTLLWLLVAVGNYGVLADRYEIFRILVMHGLVASRTDVERLANSAAVSNIGRFADLLRQWLASKEE
jgi:hypothetical protein